MTVKSIPAPAQPIAPMSEIDVLGGTALTTPIAAPPDAPAAGGPSSAYMPGTPDPAPATPTHGTGSPA